MRSKADLGEGNVAACTIKHRRPTARAPLRALTFADVHRRGRERERAFGPNRACRTTPRTQPCGSILYRVYEWTAESRSHSYAVMRISLRSGILTRQGNRVMTRNLKKGRRIGRTPKTGGEPAISPRRVIVFKPSAILKQRINGHSSNGVA
jgi:hypothetical protein